jgi:RNA polymerase sigma factor (sigma-70 family)
MERGRNRKEEAEVKVEGGGGARSKVEVKDRTEAKKRIGEAIRRVLGGDSDSYETIYREYDVRLRLYAGRRYGRLGPDFVDEVVTRTHTRAFRNLSHYDEEKSSFWTWLCWRARSVAHELTLERFDPMLVSLDDGTETEYVSPAPDPAQEHELRERNRVLRQELRSLAEQDRLTIAYHDLGDWTYTDAGLRLGMTEPQTRYRRKLGLKDLRGRVERRGVRRPNEPAPVYGRVQHKNGSDEDDERAAEAMACLPDGPDVLVGEDAKLTIRKEDDRE